MHSAFYHRFSFVFAIYFKDAFYGNTHSINTIFWYTAVLAYAGPSKQSAAGALPL